MHVLPFLSHLIGSAPKIPIIWFISAESDSLKISRKMMPATTTDVSAGMNSKDLKTPLNLSLPSFELISTASRSGMGMSSSSVKIMYFRLLPIARKNRRSFRSRSKFRSPTLTTCPGRMC